MRSKLFISCLQSVFDKLTWTDKGYSLRIGKSQLDNLRFADDNYSLISQNPQELPTTMTELNSESREIGLKMDKAKTKVIYSQNIVAPSIQIEHEDIGTVKQYVYLCQLVHREEKELKRRATMTRSKFGKPGKYLQNSWFPPTLKKKIFLQCVVPTLLYASEARPIIPGPCGR